MMTLYKSILIFSMIFFFTLLMVILISIFLVVPFLRKFKSILDLLLFNKPLSSQSQHLILWGSQSLKVF